MTKQSLAMKKLEQFLSKGRWALYEKLPPERDLCLELLVSRGTLRLALHALAGKGFVEMKHGSGAYVKALPQSSYQKLARHDSLLECLDALYLILPPLCESATKNISPTQILELENFLPKIGLALHALNSLEFAQTQQFFLQKFIACLNNIHIHNTIESLFPTAKILAKYLEKQKIQQWEEIFALLAQSLNACRKMQGSIAAEAIQKYIAFLKTCCNTR